MAGAETRNGARPALAAVRAREIDRRSPFRRHQLHPRRWIIVAVTRPEPPVAALGRWRAITSRFIEGDPLTVVRNRGIVFRSIGHARNQYRRRRERTVRSYRCDP